MRVELLFQDPTGDSMVYTVDAIAAAAKSATSGYAVFAFATLGGVELLLGHDAIRRLTEVGRLDIIVGIDAITNRQTLVRLRQGGRDRPGLIPRVFWNTTASLFHPKFCTFSNERREVWIIGSGNLTPRGLRDNYEAFVVMEGKPAEFASLRSTFEHFLARHAEDIRTIDSEALERASQNKPSRPIREIEPPEDRPAAKRPSRNLDLSSDALVAELPKGGTRWQQANFDGDTVRHFFGIEPTSHSLKTELFFSELDRAGIAVSQEVRRFTFTRSRNLRVQLAAKNGIEYPMNGRPIAVFRKVKPRHFIYQLLLPGEKGFHPLRRLLNRQESGPVRRHMTSMDKLRSAWPRNPLG